MSQSSHIKLTSSFTGGQLDTDSELRSIRSPNFRAALNVRNGKGIEGGIVENAVGNYETNFHSLPVGTNKTIGFLEDPLENTFFYFIYNSNNNHQIVRHYPFEARSVIIAQGSALNFDINHNIHSASLVDRKYLYWTDAYETDTGLTGNEPRKLNVVKANNYLKKYEYEWHFALDDQFTYTTLNGTSIDVVGSTTLTINFSGLTNRLSAINFVRAALTTGGYTTSVNTHTLVFSASSNNQTITTTAATTWARLVPYNFYTTTNISATHITWAKAQPQYAPSVLHISDTQGKRKKQYSQYCVRYIYDDGEKSAWGEYSITPYIEYDFYKTLIDFYDEKLHSLDWLTIIKKVEIGVRYGNTQSVKSLAILETSEIGFVTLPKPVLTPSVNSMHYIHIGDLNGLDVGSDDNTPSNETQVLKSYDHIPELVHSIDMISDENGSTIAVVGNTVRGKNNIITDISMSVSEVTMYLTVDSRYIDSTDPQWKRITLKPYERYKIGIVYADAYGREGAVQYCDELFTTKKRCQTSVQFTIRHLPPSWATSWKLVRTKGLTSSSYQCQKGSTSMNGVATSDGFSEWLLGYISIANDTAADLKVLFSSGKRSDFSLVNKGDKLRVWTTANGDISYDLDIQGYKISSTGALSVFTKYIALSLTGDAEIYRSNVNEEQFYYSTGIKLPVTGGYHIGTTQTQTASLPAIVELIGGDTKWDTIVTTPFYSKEYYFTQLDEVPNEDIGKANIVDLTAKQEWFKNEIRFSERYNLHSNYNGLSAFRSLDYIEVNYQFGSIQKLTSSKHSLLVVCQYKIQPIYVNRDRMLDFNANQSIGRTSRILNIAEETAKNWGTRNPESIFNVDGVVYGWDSYNGIVWRFGQDGQSALSDRGNHNFFKRIGRERMTQARLTDKVVMGYEKEYDTIYITFNANALASAFTVGYEDSNSDTSGWKGNYSFTPEMYAQVNGQFYTFRAGTLNSHMSNIFPRCNFYGVQYDAYIEFSVNELPLTEKIPQNISILSDKLWWVDRIYTVPSKDFPSGQESRIKAGKFTNYEGKWCADVMRDMNDDSAEFASLSPLSTKQATAVIRGRHLRDTAFGIRLKAADPSVRNRLIAVETAFIISESTKTS